MKPAPLADASGTFRQCADMTKVRVAIDAIDQRLVALIAERMHYIDEAARIKANRDTVRDDARVADVLAKTRAEAQRLGCNPEVVVAAFKALVEASIAHEFTAFDRKPR